MNRTRIEEDLALAKTLGVESKESKYSLHRSDLDKLIMGFVNLVRGMPDRRAEQERLYALLESTRINAPETFPDLFDEIERLCSEKTIAA